MSIAEIPRQESEFERVPPHDLNAEQCVLGGMMLSQDAISDVVEELRSTDFYRPAHQIIYDVVLDLYGRGEPADAVTVGAELTKRGEHTRTGGAPYLFTLINSVPTAANAGYYAKIVQERSVLRRLVEAGTRIVQLGYASGADADDLLDQAQAEVYAIADKRSGEDYLQLSDIMPGALDEIEAIGSRDGTMVGVPTGFTDLDSLTNGLHAGQMVVIAARPAMGKALDLDTPLATPSGWTTMGATAPGDVLLGSDGRPTRVVAVSEVLTGRVCHEVVFRDGSRVVADAAHLWTTRDAAGRTAVLTTAELAATLHTPTGSPNHTIPLHAPLDLPPAALPVAPYTLGAHLAAATLGTPDLDPEIEMRAELPARPSVHPQAVDGSPAAALGVAIGQRGELLVGSAGPQAVDGAGASLAGRSSGSRGHGGALSAGVHGGPQAVDEGGALAVGALGGEPVGMVPGDAQGVDGLWAAVGACLRGSVGQRRALLAGVLDVVGEPRADGSVVVAGLPDGFVRVLGELLVGLGLWCETRQGAGRAEVVLVTDEEVFRLTAKRLAHKEARATGEAAPDGRKVVAVREVPSRPVKCVQVDAADRLYLAGPGMVATHNSTLALDFVRAASIKHGLTSAFFSLEMGRNEITMRLLSAEARVALHAMRSGTMNDDDWTRLARRMSEVAEAPLFIDDSPNMSMMEIRAKCRRLKQQHDLRLVVIDYLQLMSSGKRVESRQVEVSEFSRSLKLLAKELQVPVIALSQLNRGPEQRTDKRPMVSDLRESGCVTATTRLTRADTNEEITIGELHTSGTRDIPVWALDDRLKYVPRTLTHAFSSGRKEVFRVTLASGRQVEATANHPFLTHDGWRPLGSLEPGSRVAAPRHVPPPLHPAAMDEDELVVLADRLGEASRVSGGMSPSVAVWPDEYGTLGPSASERFVPHPVFALPKHQVALFLGRLWAADGGIRWDEAGDWCEVSYTSESRRLVDDVSRLLLRFGVITATRSLPESGGHPARHRLHIVSEPDRLAFLDVVGPHLPDPEAVRRTAARLRQRKAKATTPWRALTDPALTPSGDGARMSAKTADGEAGGRPDGWKADALPGADRLVTTRAAVGSPSPGGHGDGSPVARSVGGAVSVAVRDDVWDEVAAILADEVTASGTSSRDAVSLDGGRRLGRVAEVLNETELDLVATNDVFWDEITSVESLGVQDVYDATVMGLSNFIANGIALHNSIEQDADMVILLHREDAYEKESPRAGEADLIVAKHRNGPTATITVAFQGHYSRFVDMATG
ncbi:replicative DNA helicase [Actinocorallia sp. API 0066]|uniref:replicative DNA helicase n=1 Tax=Actinocorallia sp. API 0066 TaxID=2896846 RepID=UPI001E59252F|nr:replicative DNA helicase [Actinocorallia sp. API 0066]MCD0453226.1 replicative DNA helicase [Actinocorallia sp. API 0066]